MSSIERGLIIKAPWARAIASGQKRWELRNRPTEVRGEVAILEGGSCLAVGVMEIVDCLGPLGPEHLRQAARDGLILPTEIHDADHVSQYAWVVGGARALPAPVPYRHPRGAVVWVKIDPQLGMALEPAPTRKPRRPR